MDVLLVSAFAAFILALLTPLIDLVALFIGATSTNAVFSLLCSAGGNLFIGYSVKSYILHVVADAFLGRLLLTVAERVSTYRPTVINPSR